MRTFILGVTLICSMATASALPGWTPLAQGKKTGEFSRLKSGVFCGETHCNAEPIDADPTSFEVLPGTKYARDKGKVYYPKQLMCSDSADCGICYCTDYVVEHARPASFQYLGNEYAADGPVVYFRGRVLKDADGQSARVIVKGEYLYLLIDRAHVFVHEKILAGADPQTFTVQMVSENEYIFQDRNKRWKYTPPDTIELLGSTQPAKR